MDANWPGHQIPKLVEDLLAAQSDFPAVAAIAKEHGLEPVLVYNYASAKSHMQRPNYCGGVYHKSQLGRHTGRRSMGDQRDYGTLDAFVYSVCKEFTRLNIPVHCSLMTSDKVHLVHSTSGRDLPGQCWDIFGHIGRASAVIAGVPLLWHGEDGRHLYEPWLWSRTDL